MFHVALYLAYVKAGYSVAGAKAQALAYGLVADDVHCASLRLHVKHHGAGSLRLDKNGRICGI